METTTGAAAATVAVVAVLSLFGMAFVTGLCKKHMFVFVINSSSIFLQPLLAVLVAAAFWVVLCISNRSEFSLRTPVGN